MKEIEYTGVAEEADSRSHRPMNAQKVMKW